jgi:[protein-PII] uridylyltransferase
MPNISESLKKQREQILTDHSQEMLSRHTSLIEIAIISLYNRMVNRLNLDAEQFRASGAVLAAGTFGRGLLGPNQTAPILFLRSETSPWLETWVAEICSPLVEAGWVVDAHEGTVEMFLDRALKDFDFFLSLLEARYISGSRQVAEQLESALEVFVQERRNDLLDALYSSVQARLGLLEDPISWMEPDLDKGPGGLKEIAAIRAACRVASNIRSLEDAIYGGYLTRQEVDQLQLAEKTYARLLNGLRTLVGASTSTLGFNEQALLAEKLGYQGRSGFLPVETFMQNVYQLFHGVLSNSQEFWERLLEGREEVVEEDEVPSSSMEMGLVARSERIHIQTDRYPANAGNIVHLFALAAQHQMRLANVTRQWIRHHRNALDTAAGDQSVRDELLTLIRADAPELRFIREFHSQGLMNSLIPELTAIHGLVQHDAFHLYPVQEHHFRTLTELKKIFRGDYNRDEPELTQISRTIEDPTSLYLAGLLHDIGKSSGRGHAMHGGEMIPAVARRLGLNAEESELLQFLVAQHLLLIDNASMRDLADDEMVANCASIIGTIERLDLLALLSLADMVATGPKGYQKWRDTPVIALCERIRHVLERGEPSPQAITERVAHIRSHLAGAVSDLIGTIELENYLANLAPRYALSMAPAAVARHLRMAWHLRHSGEMLALEVAVADGAAEITLVSRETSGLVYRSAGILTLHDMDIRGAQVFAMNEGEVILVFQCRFAETKGRVPDWDAVRVDLKRLLEGKMALNYRIAAHTASRKLAQRPLRKAPSQILVDNESNAKYTILEVYTLDRVGLLYTITRTLFELQIRIFVAKITTKVDQVADVFYIRTYQGEKVTDPEQVEEIKNALLFWLDRPNAKRKQGED